MGADTVGADTVGADTVGADTVGAETVGADTVGTIVGMLTGTLDGVAGLTKSSTKNGMK